MKNLFASILSAVLLLFVGACSGHAGNTNQTVSTNLVATNASGDTVVLLIRHAEKPLIGTGLSSEGEIRAKKLADYFTHYTMEGKPVVLDRLFATKDSDNSKRPRLTIEPLSKATGLIIDDHFKNQQYKKLAEYIRKNCQGNKILISWHQGTIPEFLTALGVNPRTLLPKGNWPSEQFNWVIQLRFDKDWNLAHGSCEIQNLK
jgi:hypothetical protein